jgi:TorA maturation chaperone TorD
MSGAEEEAERSQLEQEEAARAEFYALLARLFYAGPDAALLQAIALTGAGGGTTAGWPEPAPLGAAWRALASASLAMDAEAARDEYDSVFVGTGRAEITPYASHYLGRSAPERVLVSLRGELAALGLGRKSGAAEPEDHLAALCDVMRYLVLRGTRDAALQQQKRFFTAYIAPWYAEFCASVAASGKTNFYKPVAAFSQAFFDVEAEAFELAQNFDQP